MIHQYSDRVLQRQLKRIGVAKKFFWELANSKYLILQAEFWMRPSPRGTSFPTQMLNRFLTFGGTCSTVMKFTNHRILLSCWSKRLSKCEMSVWVKAIHAARPGLRRTAGYVGTESPGRRNGCTKPPKVWLGIVWKEFSVILSYAEISQIAFFFSKQKQTSWWKLFLGRFNSIRVRTSFHHIWVESQNSVYTKNKTALNDEGIGSQTGPVPWGVARKFWHINFELKFSIPTNLRLHFK